MANEQQNETTPDEGVEHGNAEVASLEVGELPPLPPFTRPRTTAEPEGGYQPGYPKVYFSVYDRVPPIVVQTPNEETAIDKTNFMTIPPEEEVSTELTEAQGTQPAGY